MKTNDNAPAPITICYRQHDGDGKSLRVWRSDWGGDQFNLVEKETFTFIEQTFKTFGFAVREYVQDED